MFRLKSTVSVTPTETVGQSKRNKPMTEYPEIIEEFAEQIIEVTEQRDDLDANIATFFESLEQQIRAKGI